MPHQQKDRLSPLWIVVLLLWAATSLRTIYLADTSLDHDETLTYFRAQGTLTERLEKIGEPGNQLPQFFLFTGVLPHDTDFELRLGALWFSLLGIALIVRVTASFYHDTRLTIWIAIFVAVTPFMVRFARYARPYPMLFFFSLWVSLLFLRLLQGRPVWRWYAVVSLATYLIHMAAAALPLSQLIILLWAKNPHRMLKKWLVVQMIASLPVLIWLLSYNHFGNSEMGWIHPPNIGRPYYTITHILVGYSGAWYFLLVLPVVTIALIAGIWWSIHYGGWAERYWLVLTTAPLMVLFLISQVHPFYDERYFTSAAPAYFMLVGLGWRHIPRGYWNAAWVVLICAGLTLYQLDNGHYERGDWRTSAAYVRANSQPDDCILLDAPHRIAFSFYYPGAQNVLPYPTIGQLYAGDTPSSVLTCQRLWLFIGESPGQKAKRWLATQQVIEVTTYPKMKLYLVNYTR